MNTNTTDQVGTTFNLKSNNEECIKYEKCACLLYVTFSQELPEEFLVNFTELIYN